MAINSYKMGPGTLTLGAGALAVSAQVTSCTVSADENVTTVAAIPVLTGETVPEEETATYRFKLEGNLLQDIAAAGVVAWSWTNKGTTQSFVFVPNTAAGRKVTGSVRVAPIAIGGDANSRPQSDISWAGVGGDFVLGNTP